MLVSISWSSHLLRLRRFCWVCVALPRRSEPHWSQQLLVSAIRLGRQRTGRQGQTVRRTADGLGVTHSGRGLHLVSMGDAYPVKHIGLPREDQWFWGWLTRVKGPRFQAVRLSGVRRWRDGIAPELVASSKRRKARFTEQYQETLSPEQVRSGRGSSLP